MFGLIFSSAGGYAALGAGAFYSWAASVYGYNRDNWMTDTQLRQNFAYQCENMLVSAHDMSRGEVRDRSEATITKISNYILVTTLILGLAAEIMVEGQIPTASADFILNAYMLCLGTSVLYLVLSVLFGIVAINQVYTFSADLLTDEIPTAWKDIDRKTRENMGGNLANKFEEMSWRHIFMPPMFRSMRARFASSSQAEQAKALSDGVPSISAAEYYTNMAVDDEHQSLQDIRMDYTTQYQARERNWLPLVDHSFECLALGVKHLLDCYGYLCMAHLYSKYGDAWAFWSCQMIFSSLNILIMMFLFERNNHPWMPFIVNSGPMFCALAATTPFKIVDRCCVPLCFISHLMMLTTFESKVEANACSAIPHPDDRHDIVVGQNVEDAETTPQPRNGDYTAMRPEVDEVAKSPRGRVSFSKSTNFTPSSKKASLCRVAPERERTSEIEQEASCRCLDFSASAQLSGVDESDSRDWADFETTNRLRSIALRAGGDPDDLEVNRQHTEGVLYRMMQFTRFVLRSLWFASILWALQKVLYGGGFSNEAAIWHTKLQGPPLAHVSVVKTEWPSPYFAPHTLVCPKTDDTFLADEFRIYRLSGDNQVEVYPCDVNGTIADLSFVCHDGDCWPLVLLRELPPRILECSTGKLYPLLQTTHPVTKLSAVDAHTILAAHNGQIIQYTWCTRRHGWAPSWVVADLAETEKLQSLDVTGNRMLVFRRQGAHLEESVVQVQNLRSGKQCGVWTMPEGILGAGCAVREGARMKALVRSDAVDGRQVRLVEADLHKLTGPFAKTCEDPVEDEKMPKSYKPGDARLRGGEARRPERPVLAQ